MRIISARFCGCSVGGMFLPEITVPRQPSFRLHADEPLQSSRSSPCRAVLFALRLDGLARLGPVVVTPVAQLVEIAAHRKRLRAVHGDGLAVDPVAAAGNEEDREILQF